MVAAKTALPWIDWQTIRDGVHRRNEIAHDGKLYDSQTCISEIETVEKQLTEWGILSS